MKFHWLKTRQFLLLIVTLHCNDCKICNSKSEDLRYDTVASSTKSIPSLQQINLTVVYLHDTPSKWLEERPVLVILTNESVRCYSHTEESFSKNVRLGDCSDEKKANNNGSDLSVVIVAPSVFSFLSLFAWIYCIKRAIHKCVKYYKSTEVTIKIPETIDLLPNGQERQQLSSDTRDQPIRENNRRVSTGFENLTNIFIHDSGYHSGVPATHYSKDRSDSRKAYTGCKAKEVNVSFSTIASSRSDSILFETEAESGNSAGNILQCFSNSHACDSEVCSSSLFNRLKCECKLVVPTVCASSWPDFRNCNIDSDSQLDSRKCRNHFFRSYPALEHKDQDVAFIVDPRLCKKYTPKTIACSQELYSDLEDELGASTEEVNPIPKVGIGCEENGVYLSTNSGFYDNAKFEIVCKQRDMSTGNTLQFSDQSVCESGAPKSLKCGLTQVVCNGDSSCARRSWPDFKNCNVDSGIYSGSTQCSVQENKDSNNSSREFLVNSSLFNNYTPNTSGCSNQNYAKLEKELSGSTDELQLGKYKYLANIIYDDSDQTCVHNFLKPELDTKIKGVLGIKEGSKDPIRILHDPDLPPCEPTHKLLNQTVGESYWVILVLSTSSCDSYFKGQIFLGFTCAQEQRKKLMFAILDGFKLSPELHKILKRSPKFFIKCDDGYKVQPHVDDICSDLLHDVIHPKRNDTPVSLRK